MSLLLLFQSGAAPPAVETPRRTLLGVGRVVFLWLRVMIGA